MSTFGIVIATICATSCFWLGFFIVYDDRMKKIEKDKVSRIFKNKK